MTLTFAEALTRFGRDLKEEDLQDTYSRAGRGFEGQLQQNFVVLHERINAAAALGCGASQSSSRMQRKRQRTDGGKEKSGGFGGRGRGGNRGGSINGGGRGYKGRRTR
jgi:hypothetical protein